MYRRQRLATVAVAAVLATGLSGALAASATATDRPAAAKTGKPTPGKPDPGKAGKPTRPCPPVKPGTAGTPEGKAKTAATGRPGGKGKPAGPDTSSVVCGPVGKKIDVVALAKSFGVSPVRLERALTDAKRTLGRLEASGVKPSWLHPAVVAVVARDLHVSRATATRLLRRLEPVGKDK